jgi:hypothetical protein
MARTSHANQAQTPTGPAVFSLKNSSLCRAPQREAATLARSKLPSTSEARSLVDERRLALIEAARFAVERVGYAGMARSMPIRRVPVGRA